MIKVIEDNNIKQAKDLHTDLAVYSSPFGSIAITYTNEAIVSMHLTSSPTNIRAENHSPIIERLFTQLDEYFRGIRKEFDITVMPIGTSFQKSVWNELLKIPYGETRSYKDIAIAVGNEKASRAVGMANNKNPLFILIPCHRVIGSSGKLVGYAGGLNMKKSLLEIEIAHK